MKKIMLFFASLLLVNMIQAQTDTVKVENKADISFNKIENDYGKIEQGSNGLSEFEFTNTGKVPLTLINVQSSCGCTVPQWSKEPINPGQKGKITVQYNTHNIGTFQKTISVFSNAKTNPTVLRIKGEVITKKQQ